MSKIDKSGYFRADGGSITADSTPVYFANSGVSTVLSPGSWFHTGSKTDQGTGLPGWTWQNWATWYGALQSKYGTDKANQIWADAWQRGLASTESGDISDPETGSGVLWNSVPIDAKYDDNFLAWIKGKDYLYNVVFNGVLGKSAAAIDTTTKVVTDIGSGIGSLGSGLGNSLKVVSYVVPVLLVLTAAGIVWWGFKKVKTS